MARESFLYTSVFTSAFNGEINASSDEFKAMLVTEDYTPDLDAHAYKDDITDEASGDGYSAGGNVVGNFALTIPSLHVWKIDCDDPTFFGIDLIFRYVVLYDNEPSGDGNKPVIALFDMGENLSFAGEDFRAILNTSGLLNVTIG